MVIIYFFRQLPKLGRLSCLYSKFRLKRNGFMKKYIFPMQQFSQSPDLSSYSFANHPLTFPCRPKCWYLTKSGLSGVISL